MSEINYNYEKMTPFKWFILENFPFLEDSINVLTNYQLFCKLGEEINKNRDAINSIGLNDEQVVNAFNQLHDYVEHYFDNLDVQEEINNKLDEMVQQGTLQEIIAEYINSTTLWCFNTVNDMKDATNLINGSYARTVGYAAANDGFGGLYYISDTIPENENEDDIIENLDSGLYAVKVFNKTNPSINDFRKYCTNINGYLNWTPAFNFAISKFNSVKLESDIYYINDTITINREGVSIKGNNALTSRITLIPNTQMTTNFILKIMNNNIELKDFYLQGDENSSYSNNGLYILGGQTKLTNLKIRHIKGTGITFEFPSYDCVLDNIQVYDCTSHGMVINATDCIFTNCFVHDVGRHGYEVIRGSNFFNNCKAYLTGKINAESVVDAQAGVGFFIHSDSGNARTVMLSNCHAQECGTDGFRLSKTQGVTLENCISDSNCVYSDGIGINLNNSDYNILKNCLIVNKQFLTGWIKTALNVNGYYNNIDVIINPLDNSPLGTAINTKFFTNILRGNKSSTNIIKINNTDYLPLDYQNPMCFDGSTSGIAKDFTKYVSSDSFSTNAYIQRDEKYQVLSITGTTAVNDEVGISLDKTSLRPSLNNIDVSFIRKCSSENGLVVGCKIAWYDSSDNLLSTTTIDNISPFEENPNYGRYWTDYHYKFVKPNNTAKYVLSLYLKVTSNNSTGSAYIKDLKIMYS